MKKTGIPTVYLLASGKKGYFYVGVTSELMARMYRHTQEPYQKSYAKQHNIDKLVWYREYESMAQAIAAEKQIKRWSRAKKYELVEEINPSWNDLYKTMLGSAEMNSPRSSRGRGGAENPRFSGVPTLSAGEKTTNKIA
jgi:putative endonuclease